jgi:MFS family permease
MVSCGGGIIVLAEFLDLWPPTVYLVASAFQTIITGAMSFRDLRQGNNVLILFFVTTLVRCARCGSANFLANWLLLGICGATFRGGSGSLVVQLAPPIHEEDGSFL